MSKSKTIAALEIGTGKMQVFIGEIVDGKMLNFIGSGQASAVGVKKADICDVVKAAAQAQDAIVKAEQSSGTQIKSVCLGISGTHIKGFRNTGSANVSGADAIVRRNDVERACEDAKSKSLAEGRSYIHRICSGYYLDGKYCADPVGEHAEHIEASYWLLHGDSEKIRDALHVVQSFGLEVEHLVFSGVASALAITDARQKEDGVLVVDIGCGTSDYACVKHGRTMQTGVIPVGGDHITNDLRFGLRLSSKDSERIKKSCARAIVPDDEKNLDVWNVGDGQIGDRKFTLDSINKIVRPRLEELFLMLRDDVGEFIGGDDPVKEVVLTGGTSNLTGICELASAVLELPCSKGKFNNALPHNLCKQGFATALGLLEYARMEEETHSAKKIGWFGGIQSLFNF